MTRIWRALVLVLLLTRPVGAQQPPSHLADALARRDRGDLSGAIAMLRARLQVAPDDGTARRFLAQTLYWNREFEGAREQYERGVAQHPGDLEMRIDYARMLVETGDGSRARPVLEPVLTSRRAAAAHTLLGTVEYWRGDWTRAARHFRAAMAADSMASDARQGLSEIASATTPWVRAALEVTSDNQPLRATSPVAEAGAYLTPLWSAGVRVRGTSNSNAVAGSTTWQHLEGFTAGTLVPGRLRLEAAVGPARRADASRLMGQADLALVVRRPVSLGARVARRPYAQTIGSIRAPVWVDEAGVRIGVADAAGWSGEAAAVRQRYPDRNTLTTAHVWVLAPLLRHRAVTLHAGYAASHEHARALRFVRADSMQDAPPSFRLAGRYDPYYTPDRLSAHAALGVLSFRARNGASLTIDGAYAVHARDRAPFFYLDGTPPTPTLGAFDRTFHPVRAGARWRQPLARGTTLEVQGAWLRTIFYDARQVGVSLVWRGRSAMRTGPG